MSVNINSEVQICHIIHQSLSYSKPRMYVGLYRNQLICGWTILAQRQRSRTHTHTHTLTYTHKHTHTHTHTHIYTHNALRHTDTHTHIDAHSVRDTHPHTHRHTLLLITFSHLASVIQKWRKHRNNCFQRFHPCHTAVYVVLSALVSFDFA